MKRTNNGKKIMCVLLLFVLAVAFLFPVSDTEVFAAENDFVIDQFGTLDSYNGIGGAITIPDGVKIIGKKAFAGNNNITKVTLPNSVTTIETSAFDSCTALKEIKLSSRLDTIEDSAFWGCVSLKSIEFPSTVKKIGFGAFCKCDSLTGVYLPNSIKEIGNYAFGYVNVGGSYVQEIDYTIMGENKSAGKKYADKYSIPFVTKDSLMTSISSVSKKAGNKLVVKWKKNTKVSGYEIQYSTSSKFASSKTKTIRVGKASATSKTISKLKKGNTYYVRIRGYRTISGKKYNSSWGKTVKKSL